MTEKCPFCPPRYDSIFHEGNLVIGVWDAFPVTPGHALIVTRRHVASWFDATSDEKNELLEAADVARKLILRRVGAEGFNIGVNIGAAAGQTVSHLHLHVIPRRAGDVRDPRGGVRHVIPGKANYLLRAEASVTESAPVLLSTGGDKPLFPLLTKDLSTAARLDVAVAFALPSGVDRIIDHLSDLLNRGGELRLVTGDYLDITDPLAVQRLLDLKLAHPQGKAELRVFESAGTSFHPKAYILATRDSGGVAYIGSSNLSRSAFEEGIEWNYRVIHSRDKEGFDQVCRDFEILFRHPSTRPMDSEWLSRYRSRRRPDVPRIVDAVPEPPEPPPRPNEVQAKALALLENTRANGYAAGLVVMATGLGKTWLAAFDSSRPEFRRILYVAHREEILEQAMKTFRRIRPGAEFGWYNGGDKQLDADVIFASIQTLGRRAHLEHFEPTAFDYVVVDEFHHAAAATYRRLIDHFDPKFLLGLTATPERTDGDDLLQLCQENLVYRCDLPEGIRRGLLCPFHYFGVPDIVDYSNIPWRSNRFDEEELTSAVATRARALNALEQWQQRAGGRTLAFCVSQRHADFMRSFFREKGIRVAAVHSGESSDPRAASLELLGKGELDVVFAVDMFNEGVDIPSVEAVMMLRPTESRILWLQQLGRGLRLQPGKTLRVIDYIGNHRTFLIKARTLLQISPGNDRELAAALERVQNGTFDLPPGCEVTYDLEAINIVRGLLRLRERDDILRLYYEDFRERNGYRPTASEAFHDGYNPRSVRRYAGSWIEYVRSMGDLSEEESKTLADHSDFLDALEITPMTKSFKMLVFLCMLNTDSFPGYGIRIEQLSEQFRRLANRSPILREDMGEALQDDGKLQSLIVQNPIEAWVGGKGTGDTSYFEYADKVFRFRPTVPLDQRQAIQSLVREIAEWRLAEYQTRSAASAGATDVAYSLKVSHANGRPMIFLHRDKNAGLPNGWNRVLIDGEPYDANFVDVALNVIRKPDNANSPNELPGILRNWYGPDAGQPGTRHMVVCESRPEGWTLRKAGNGPAEDQQLNPWSLYLRQNIPGFFGETFQPAIWNAGIVIRPRQHPSDMILLVTLEKGGMNRDHRYADHFVSPEVFQWQSQNQTTQSSKRGQQVRDHKALGIAVHLFVRKEKVGADGKASPFVYCGPVHFDNWEGDSPITVQWRLESPVPERLREYLNIAG